MSDDRLRDAVESGETLRFETSLRRGGRLGVTDDRVIIANDDAVVAVELENISEVTIESIDWFLVVLSIALVGVGGYGVSVLGNLPLGAVFVLAGIGNFYLTYRKRNRIRLVLHTRARPITVYPDDVPAVRHAIDAALEPYRGGVTA